MSDYQIEVYRYSLPLVRPLRLKDLTIEEREGLILRRIGPNGLEGVGEAAPLPGFSAESVDEAAELLARDYLTPNEEERHRTVTEVFQRRATSVSFANTSSVLSLDKESIFRHRLKRDVISINALLSLDAPDFELEVQRIVKQQSKVIKCKVGRLAPQEEIARLKAVAASVGDAAVIRLDANRAWDLESAERFLREIADLPIEYIEEPLQNSDENMMLRKRIPFRLAADESYVDTLLDPIHREQDFPAWSEFLVIKPMLTGNPEEVLYTAEKALEQGITPVISACFESGVGITHLACIAAWLDTEVAVGLDTYSWLAEDVLRERLPFRNGVLDVRDALRCLETIDWDRMELVYRSG